MNDQSGSWCRPSGRPDLESLDSVVAGLRIPKRSLPDVPRLKLGPRAIDWGTGERIARYCKGISAMRDVLEKKEVHSRAAEDAIGRTLLYAIDCHLEQTRRDANRGDRKAATKEVRRLLSRLKKLVDAITALPSGEIGKLNKALSPLLARPFDTEVFEMLVATIAAESPGLTPAVKARRVYEAIYESLDEKFAGLRREATSDLIDGWRLIPASTRTSVERELRTGRTERSIAKWLRRLIDKLEAHPDHRRGGADPALVGRFLNRAAREWTRLGLRVGRATLSDGRARAGAFQQFCAAALFAVGEPAILSEHGIRNARSWLYKQA